MRKRVSILVLLIFMTGVVYAHYAVETYSHPTLGFEIDIPRAWSKQYCIQTTETGVAFIHYLNGEEGSKDLYFLDYGLPMKLEQSKTP